MRVMMLSDLYEPFVGGLERYVQNLSRELSRRGHDVSVVTLWCDGERAEEVDPYGVRIFRVGGWSRMLHRQFRDAAKHFHPPAPDPGTMHHLAHLIGELSPQIVNSHSWILYSYLPLASRFGARTVHTLHDYRLVCPKQNYLRHGAPCCGPSLRRCLRCAPEQYGHAKAVALTMALRSSSSLHPRVDRYLAISASVAQASRSRTGAASSKITVVPSAVPDGIVEEGLATPRPAFLPPTDGFVLFVGALTAHKGVDVLLDAYRRMRSDVSLVLLGTTRADTPTTLPPGVTLQRDVSHPQVMASWLRSALGVVPSVAPEGLPLVAIEAMACGNAVVASDVGGLPEVVAHEQTGLLVSAGDADMLARALDALLADPARRARMGAEARRRASRFMMSAVANRVERIYEEVVDDR
jgi:glycosyltransferase involved in cell wall biosynthesis